MWLLVHRRKGRTVRDLNRRITELEQDQMPSGPVLVYQGETKVERTQAATLVAAACGAVILVSMLDLAL